MAGHALPFDRTARRHKAGCRAALLATLLTLAAGAQAQPALPAAQSYAQATSTDYAGGACDSGLRVGTRSITAACASVSPGSSSGAQATAGPGSVRISSNADVQSIGTASHSGNGWSSASFVDWIAIQGPAGKTGVLTGTLYFSGGVGASASGSANSATNAGASYNFSASFFGQNAALSGNVLEATNGTSNSNDAAGGAFTVTATVSFGSDGWAVGAITMNAITQSDASARPYQATSNSPVIDANAHAAASFGHTLYWGGISSLTVDGVALTGYALTSASGVDYSVSTAPVPEPGAAALLLIGLGLVARQASRRRP
jgi:hypothetical protein